MAHRIEVNGITRVFGIFNKGCDDMLGFLSNLFSNGNTIRALSEEATGYIDTENTGTQSSGTQSKVELQIQPTDTMIITNDLDNNVTLYKTIQNGDTSKTQTMPLPGK